LLSLPPINALRLNYHCILGKLDVLCSPGTGSGSLRLLLCGSAFRGRHPVLYLFCTRLKNSMLPVLVSVPFAPAPALLFTCVFVARSSGSGFISLGYRYRLKFLPTFEKCSLLEKNVCFISILASIILHFIVFVPVPVPSSYKIFLPIPVRSIRFF
jgi:hypothetical protein